MVWTDIFIKRPVLSVVVSLLILLIGFRAATSLPVRQYPKLSNTVVNVTTVYPGASAELIQGSPRRSSRPSPPPKASTT
jgi:multidrug efflux pump